MSNQNNLNNLFSNGLFQNTPNKDQQKPAQNIFNTTYQGSTPFQTNTLPSSSLQNTNPFPSSSLQNTNPFPSSSLQNTNPFQSSSLQNNPLQTTTSSNPFGMPSSQPNASQFSLPAPSTNTYTGMTPNTNSNQLFGNNQTPSWSTNTPVGNIFGQKSSSIGLKNGTKDKKYEPQKIKEERGFGFLEYNHINAMKEYNEKSADELRYEDYNLGRRPNPSSTGFSTNQLSTGLNTNQSSTGFSTNMYGNTGQSTSTSLFGMNQQYPGKQEQSIFSQPTSSGFSLPSAQLNQQSFISTPSISQAQPSSTSAPFSTTTSNTPPSSSLFGTTPQTQNLTNLQFSNNTPFGNNIPFTSNTPFSNNNNTSTSMSNNLGSQPQFDNTMISNTSFQPSFAFNSSASTFPMTQTQPFSIPQSNYQSSNYQNSSISCADVDKSDPYGIKGIKFKFIEKELSPFQRLLAEPIHKENEKLKINKGLDFRPPEDENAYDVYFTPALHEIRGMRRVSNLVMTFPGKGQIEYLEPVDVSELTVKNVTKKVLFTRDHVFITDRPGKGLNLAAKVSIDKVFPICKSENRVIVGRSNKYPEKGIQDRFVYYLKKNGTKEFIDYDFNKGTLVYKVDHF